jgi:hypothetical protein
MIASALVSLLVSLGQLQVAMPPPPPAPVVIHMDDIGVAWRGGLPRATLHPERGRRTATLGAIADLGEWIALTRTLKTEAVLKTPDFANEIALFVITDDLLAHDFHGLHRDATTLVLEWARSPNFVAVPGPHLLLVVVPRAGARAVRFRDVARSDNVDQGTVPL